ncbi:alpha-1,2-fucosyltransferase [Helicobacter sp. 11S02629-2]|uniref:alpha-1,2-fucosyltransferase n=1 Tax=Helicobacter sp. 11S02629-2 TaxID=1476195 RepID=UPI000BA751DB|nr:alpha-1,2-fucosyltransferase [Helicobacter sp. 11S02629-2]PAF46004.1 hypothetical protein BKH40_00920 [Helicobacter sp. 11S02629-2]
MIEIRLQGRLGNQFFIYAFAKNLRKHLRNSNSPKLAKQEVILVCDDIHSYEVPDILKYNVDKSFFRPSAFHGFKTTIDKAFFFMFRVARKGIYLITKKTISYRHKNKEVPHMLPETLMETYENGEFDKAVIAKCLNKFIIGYFQSELYFEDVKEELKKDFSLQENHLPVMKVSAFKALLTKIKEQDSIFLHIRRGDYLSSVNVTKYAQLGVNYYTKAIALVLQKCPNAKFYIFSDDVAWVKKEGISLFGLNKLDYEVVNLNSPNAGYLDLELMKACKGAITANSSFSYWGAYLMENPKVVIAPFPFHFIHSNMDLLPRDFIVLDCKTGEVLEEKDYMYTNSKSPKSLKVSAFTEMFEAAFDVVYNPNSGGGGGNIPLQKTTKIAKVVNFFKKLILR